MWRYIAAAAVVVALGLVALTDVPAPYVLGPLLGLLIARVGLATFASLRAGGAHIPHGDPEPVDPRRERITYWCEGCGAEVLLLVRGTPMPPRHCGERMIERHEVARAE
jgi:predicted RNA-binding Zn-ribbon protein involved in translation (DUF1610 family)